MTAIAGDAPPSELTAAPPATERDPGLAFVVRLRRWRPSVITLLGVLVAFTFVIPAAYVVPSDLGAAGRPSLLIGLGLLLIWMLIFLRSTVTRAVQPVRWLMGAYLAVWLISVAIAYQRGLSSIEASGVERYLLITLALTGIGLITADLIPDRRSLDRLLRYVVYGGVFMGVVGFLQFQFRIDLVELIDVPFLRVNGDLIGLGERGGPGFARATATAAHSIEYGVLSAMLLPLAIHYALGAHTGRQRRWWWVAVALVGGGILFSLSRSGVLAGAAVVFVILRCWKGRGKTYLLGLGVVVLATTYVVLPGLLGTFRSFFVNTSNDPSIQGRTDDYELVAHLFGERPWFGLGGGSFRPEEYFILDNYIFNALLGTGLVGLLTVLALFFGLYGLGMRMLRRVHSAEDRNLAGMLAASGMAGLVASFTFDSLNFATFATTFFLLLGAAGALWRLRDSDPIAERDALYAKVVKSTDEAWPGLFRYLRPGPVPVASATSPRPRTSHRVGPSAVSLTAPPAPPPAEPTTPPAPAQPTTPPAAAEPAEPLAVAGTVPVVASQALTDSAPARVPIEKTASVTDRGEGSFRTALGWSTAMNVGRQAATLAITFVLAALLGPRDFGVVAMATVYVAFVQLLVQQGMGAAIIQRPNLSDDHLHTAFWMLSGASVALAVLSAMGSGIWASVNDLPELQGVILALTPLVVLTGLLIVPDALLRRGMNFRPLALRTNASVAIGGIVGIGAAVAGWGVWALVAQQLTTAVLEVVIVWAAVSWRPRARWSPQSARELLSFTVPSSVATVGVFANNRADAFITGLLLGPTAVGLYRFASRLVETVVQAIMGSIRAVALPELARYQLHPDRLARRILDLTFLTSAAALVPLAALAAAGPAVIALIGEDWSPAIPALGLLAVAGAGRTISSLAGPTLQAIGRPGLLAILTWLGAALMAGALVVTGLAVQDADTATQVQALAIATMIVSGGLLLVVGLWTLVACTRVTVRGLAASIVTPLAAAATGYLLGVVVDSYLAHDLAPLIRAAVVGVAAFAQAVLVLALLDDRVWALLDQVRSRSVPSSRSTEAASPSPEDSGRPL